MPTGAVVTVNVAEEDPAGTVTLAGAVALALSLDNATVIPPSGAAPVKVTVPVVDVPPVTAAGFMLTPASAAGVIVKSALCVPL